MSINVDRLKAALSGLYEIEREVGRGATAAVYLALDVKQRRHVAIKVLLPELAEALAANRFHREIDIAAQLVHPHIMPLFSSGDADGFLYYVMPFMDGESLRELLEVEGQLPVVEALRIAEETADGLAHAHGHGVIHRDIKPANILLSGGHALIADFGIARAIVELAGTKLTASGLVPGTVPYMSPEQAGGEQDLDGRSDIYALGCVLYEMLAGRPPLMGASIAATISRRATEKPAPIGHIRETVTPEIDGVLQRALAKLPADRYPKAADFAEALNTATEHLSTGTSGSAVPSLQSDTITLTVEQVSRDRRQQRRRLLGVAIAALAVGAVSVPVYRSFIARGLAQDRVVVAPLENRTGDPDLDVIGRNATAWITRELIGTSVVDVVPTLTALQSSRYVAAGIEAGEFTDPIRELASETGAGVVITGGYVVERDTFRVTVEVTDVAHRRVLGSVGPVTGPLSSIDESLAELGGELLGFLAASFDEKLEFVSVGGRPPTLASFEAYDQAINFYLDEEYDRAIPLFRRSFELDSSFVVPFVFLAISHLNRDEWAQVDSVVELATEYDSLLTPYHRHWVEHIRALVAGDNERAMSSIRMAAHLVPNSKAVYNMAHLAARVMNRPREAIENLEGLDPQRGLMRGWIWYWTVMATAQHMLGEHGDELKTARQARELYPDRLRAAVLEAQALAGLGRIDDLMRLVEELPTLGSAVDANLGDVLLTIAMDLRAHDHADASNEIFRRAIRWFQTLPPERRTLEENRRLYAQILYEAAEDSLAEVEYSKLNEDFPDNVRFIGALGVLAAFRGERAEALQIAAWLENLGGSDQQYMHGLHTEYRARIHSVLGDYEKAFELVRTAFNQGQHFVGDIERFDWRHPGRHYLGMLDHAPFQQWLNPKG